MQRAILYIRFSTPGQATGDSERRQIEAAKAYAADHEVDLSIISDKGISGYSGDHATRGQLAAFIRDLSRGVHHAGTILLVEDLTRFSRQNSIKALSLLTSIIDAGGRLHDLSERRTYDAEADVMTMLSFLIRQSSGHQESREKSRRVSAAWSRKKAEASTTPLTRQCHYGIKVVGSGRDDRNKTAGCKYEIVESDARIVRRIYQLTADGYSDRSIIRTFAREGIRPPRGKLWSRSSIRRILREDRYLGYYQPHTGSNKRGGKREPVGDPIPNVYPQIIDDDLAKRARARLTERATGKATTHASSASNLLTGVARCTCGGSLSVVNKGKRSSGKAYVCRDYLRGDRTHHNSYGKISVDKVEWQIINDLAQGLPLDGDDHQHDDDQLQILKDKLTAAKDDVQSLRRQADDTLRAIVECTSPVVRQGLEKRAESLLDEAEQAEARLPSIMREIEAYESSMANRNATQQGIIDLLQQAISRDDLQSDNDLRIKIKTAVRDIVSSIIIDAWGNTIEYHMPDGRIIRREIGKTYVRKD